MICCHFSIHLLKHTQCVPLPFPPLNAKTRLIHNKQTLILLNNKCNWWKLTMQASPTASIAKVGQKWELTQVVWKRESIMLRIDACIVSFHQLHLLFSRMRVCLLELTPLVPIGTEWTYSCESNYHTITTTMTPYIFKYIHHRYCSIWCLYYFDF
jgi:hypothetical protein